MLTYTNHLKPLKFPEYGRNIQNMVDRCLEIEDRNQRTVAAESVVASMLTLFPPTGDKEEYVRKLWDHVLMMSDFKLDIDLPYEPVDPTVFNHKPEPLKRPELPDLRDRIYGKYIHHLADIASEMPEGEERDALVMMVANQMKKVMIAEHKEGIEDVRIFEDLYYMSHGNIQLYPDTTRLHDYRQAPVPSGKKKKKK